MKNQFANDKEFMLALVAYNGTYLEHASEELKAVKTRNKLERRRYILHEMVV